MSDKMNTLNKITEFHSLHNHILNTVMHPTKPLGSLAPSPYFITPIKILSERTFGRVVISLFFLALRNEALGDYLFAPVLDRAFIIRSKHQKLILETVQYQYNAESNDYILADFVFLLFRNHDNVQALLEEYFVIEQYHRLNNDELEPNLERSVIIR